MAPELDSATTVSSDSHTEDNVGTNGKRSIGDGAVKNKTTCFPVFNVLQLDGLLLVNCLITYELVLLLVGSLLFLPRFLFYTIL